MKPSSTPYKPISQTDDVNDEQSEGTCLTSTDHILSSSITSCSLFPSIVVRGVPAVLTVLSLLAALLIGVAVMSYRVGYSISSASWAAADHLMSMSRPASANIAVCLATKDQGEELLEWAWWHLDVVGVDKLYVFDNSELSSAAVLRSYIVTGQVEYMHFPSHPRVNEALRHFHDKQLAAYETCLWLYGQRHDWIAFLDTDEFLEMSDKSRSVGQLLYSRFTTDNIAVVLATWRLHGNPNGSIVERPAGGTLLNFGWCVPVPFDPSRVPQSGVPKSILRPSRVKGMRNPHQPHILSNFTAVDENLRAVVWTTQGETAADLLRLPAPTDSLIWINHYASRSRAQNEAKVRRGGGDGTHKSSNTFDRIDAVATNECSSAARVVKERGVWFS